MTSSPAQSTEARRVPEDKPQDVIIIDRSGLDLGFDSTGIRSSEHIVVVKESTGGASKVAWGDLAEFIRMGHDAVLIAYAKSEGEQFLAETGQPFFHQYGDVTLEIRFANPPKELYDLARDGYFSGNEWFRLQGQDHPDIVQPFEPAMFEAFKEVNMAGARVAASILRPGGRVWVHDGHVQRTGRQLREMGFVENPMAFIGHTAYPVADFIQREIESPGCLPPEVVREQLSDLAAYDLVNFSSTVWASNVQAAAELYGIKNFPEVSAIPVPLDAAYIRERGASPKVQKRVAHIKSVLRGRDVVGAGGRAEWYKQIDKVVGAFGNVQRWLRPGREQSSRLEHFHSKVQAYLLQKTEIRGLRDRLASGFNKLYSALGGKQRPLLVLLTSETRGTVPGYMEHFQDIVNAAALQNQELRHVSALVVNGADFDEVLAWQEVSDVAVTEPVNEGYNLMLLEWAERGDAVHVASRPMGVQHFAQTLPLRTEPFLEVNPTVVRLSRDPVIRAAEEASLEKEQLALACQIGAALRVPEAEAREMANAVREINRVMTPRAHVDGLTQALERSRSDQEDLELAVIQDLGLDSVEFGPSNGRGSVVQADRGAPTFEIGLN